MSAPNADLRDAKLAWRPIPKARTYEVELAANADFDPLLEKRKVSTPSTVFKLRPGSYFFRIRAFDDQQAPGVWSEVQGFSVFPRPPELVAPAPQAKFDEPLGADGIAFKWNAISSSQIKYEFEIRDAKGVLLHRGVEVPGLSWMPDKAGHYEWRVGIDTGVGTNWGPSRSFEVGARAIPTKETIRLVRVNASSNCSDIRWWSFEVAAFAGRQTLGTSDRPGEVYAPYLNWAPYCALTPNFALTLRVGATALPHQSGGYFTLLSSDLLLGVRPWSKLGLELAVGAGTQWWVSYGGASPNLLAQLLWRFDSWFSALYVGYSSLVATEGHPRAIEVGLRVDFSGDQDRSQREREGP